MPLARAAGGDGGSSVQARPSGSGARAAIVQRAIEMPYEQAPPAGEAPTPLPPFEAGAPVPSPEAPQSSFAGIDLERLADEVYAIIERRLTIERESRGL